ncbi:hypothetical protein [Candidatus Regiella insecticola]|uniref:hypothetical protein n=1 Tax=Candidatus Regiella insecticola TaxID=138073 RepID=UPI001596465B|nr:hypothetical protein [Candidatus Regiella insecticola]
MKKISNGLDCDVVYFLVPKTGSLENMRKKQAFKKANRLDKHAERHMNLEDQATSEYFQNENIDKLALQYLKEWSTDFWNDK